MQKIIYLLPLLVVISCDKLATKSSQTKHLEIYQTSGDEKSMQAGPLTHHESSEYIDKRKLSTSYFDLNGLLKGKELFYYTDDTDTLPAKAEYVDGQNKLLSYYKYVYNNKGQLIASYAFDASNHELLRVEQYYYNKNNMTSKRIFDSQLNPSRRYAFTHDNFGNETGFQVYNAADSLVTKEDFKITKMDKNNQWTEKWGFANGRPITFHKRN